MNSISQNPTDIALNRNFQFIEAIDSQVYIDSRVYCAEIIGVDHGDWLTDTLRKHLDVIEARFGHCRFETDNGTNRPQGGGRQQIYYLLTEDQCNACLVLSKNLVKTVQAKLDLVEDFSTAKRLLRAQLDRQFAAAPTAQLPAPVIYAAPKPQYANLANVPETEVYRLASEYVSIREVAKKQMPTLLEVLDHLANPDLIVEATRWFTAKSWLTSNQVKLSPRQARHFFLAIADCHRFLVIAQPQKIKNTNYYSNQHEILLKVCSENTLKLICRTIPFV